MKANFFSEPLNPEHDIKDTIKRDLNPVTRDVTVPGLMLVED